MSGQSRPRAYRTRGGVDKKGQRVRGEKRWIVAVMCITPRFILAWDISETKENYNTAPLLWAAKIPRQYIADDLGDNTISPLRRCSMR